MTLRKRPSYTYLVLAFAIVCLVSVFAEALWAPRTVSYSVNVDGVPDAARVDLYLPRLSAHPGLAIVERAQLETTIRELSLQRAQSAPGAAFQFSGVDLFLTIDEHTDRQTAQFRIIDALTGSVLHESDSFAIEAVPGASADRIATALLNSVPQSGLRNAIVLDVAGGTANEAFPDFLRAIRHKLQQRGVSTLERFDEIVSERILGKGGFTAGPGHGGEQNDALLVAMHAIDVDTVELSVPGRGRRTLNPHADPAAAELAAIWLQEMASSRSLSEERHNADIETSLVTLQRLRIGISRYLDGDSALALAAFHTVRSQAPELVAPRRWLRAMYAQRGLNELAGAVERCSRSAADAERPSVSVSNAEILPFSVDERIPAPYRAALQNAVRERLSLQLGTSKLFTSREVEAVAREELYLARLASQPPSIAAALKQSRRVFGGKLELETSQPSMTLWEVPNTDVPEIRIVQRALSSDPTKWSSDVDGLVTALFGAPIQKVEQISLRSRTDQVVALLEEHLSYPWRSSDPAGLVVTLLSPGSWESQALKYLSLFPGSLVGVQERQCFQYALLRDVAAAIPRSDPLHALLRVEAAVLRFQFDKRPEGQSDAVHQLTEVVDEFPGTLWAEIAKFNIIQLTGSPDRAESLKRLLALATRDRTPWIASDTLAKLKRAENGEEDVVLVPRRSSPRPGLPARVQIVAVSRGSSQRDLSAPHEGRRRDVVCHFKRGSSELALESTSRSSSYLSVQLSRCREVWRAERPTAPMVEGALRLGYLLMMQKRFTDAEELYREVLTWRGGNGGAPDPYGEINALYLLAFLRHDANDAGEALKALQLAVERCERTPQARLLRFPNATLTPSRYLLCDEVVARREGLIRGAEEFPFPFQTVTSLSE